MADLLNSLALRLEDIEESVFGQLDLSNPENNGTTLMSMITELDNRIRSLTLGQDNFLECYHELVKLNQRIKPDWSDWYGAGECPAIPANYDGTSFASKLEDVLAFEDEIKGDADISEHIQRLKSALDAPHIHRIDEMKARLPQLKQTMAIQKKQIETLDADTAQLKNAYNRWLTEVTEKLAQFGKSLDELERRKEVENN